MKSIILYGFYFCGLFVLLGNVNAEKHWIKGRVLDKTQHGIEAAYIEIRTSNDSIVQNYSLSDSLGFFAFDVGNNQEYIVSISHVAYKPFSQKIYPREKTFSFVLEENISLIDTLVVTGYEKAMRMNEEGHLVFDPNVLGNTVTYDLSRLLQTLPHVQISPAGIMQNGRATALLINGHRRNLSGRSVEAFLKNIPADRVQEIVINPVSSASNLASENGSINIILKSGKDLWAAEVNGELDGSKGGVYGNGGAFVMYNKDNFYLDFSMGYYNSFGKVDTKEESSYANSSATSQFDYQTDSRRNDYLGSLNLEWTTPQGHKLFTSATGFYDEGTFHADNRMRFMPDKETEELTHGLATQENDDDLYTVEVEFKSNDTLRHQHAVSYGIIWGKAHNQGLNEETAMYEADESVFSHHTTNRHYGYQHQMNYNYQFLLDAKSTLKAGVRVDAGRLNPESRLTEKAQGMEDFLYADRYQLRENIYAGYLEYAYKYDNYAMTAGLRVEHTDYSARSKMDNTTYDYHRTDYFPFITLRGNFSSVADVTLSFASGINRPHFLDYVPNFRYTSRYAYSMGNPELVPSKFYSLTWGTLLLDFLYIGLTYQHTKDVLSEITTTDDTNSFLEVTTSMNVCNENRFIFQINCPYVLLNNKLSGYLGTWFGYAKYRDWEIDLGSFYNKRYKGFYLTNQTQYEVWKNLNIGYDLYFQPKLYLQQVIADPFFKLGFDVSYKIKGVSLGFSISNVFNAHNKGVEMSESVYTCYERNRYQPIYSFTLKYDIGNMGKRKYHEGIDSSRFK